MYPPDPPPDPVETVVPLAAAPPPPDPEFTLAAFPGLAPGAPPTPAPPNGDVPPFPPAAFVVW
jgi:hypothetical protein